MKPPKPLTTDRFFALYGRRVSNAGPKHARLRTILQAALNDGLWREGDAIFTEHEIARASGYSVGTVQRAIRDLVASGNVKRIAGRGTFVTRAKSPLEGPFLNLRFLDDDGSRLLPVSASLLGRQVTGEDGPWKSVLAPSDDTVMRIERLFEVNGEFRILTRFYFDNVRFARVAALPASKIKAANLKTLLSTAYDLSTIAHRQTIRFVHFAKEISGAVGRATGSLGLLETVVGTVGEGDAVYYQELYIPPNERTLELPRSTM